MGDRRTSTASPSFRYNDFGYLTVFAAWLYCRSAAFSANNFPIGGSFSILDSKTSCCLANTFFIVSLVSFCPFLVLTFGFVGSAVFQLEIRTDVVQLYPHQGSFLVLKSDLPAPPLDFFFPAVARFVISFSDPILRRYIWNIADFCVSGIGSVLNGDSWL